MSCVFWYLTRTWHFHVNTILFCTLNFHPRSLCLVHNKLHATLMGFQTHCMTQETCVHLACHMRDMSKMFSYYLILYMCSQCAISLVQHFTCQNVTSTRKFHTIQTNKILTCVKFPKKNDYILLNTCHPIMY